MDADAAQLLDEMTALRARTRADRRGYWLPLLLFGALIAAAPLIYLTTPTARSGTTTIKSVLPLWFFSDFLGESDRDALAIAVYWVAALVVGLLVTVLWYRLRANRVGVQARIGTYLWPTFGTLALVLVLAPPIHRWALEVFFTLFGAGWVDVAEVWSGVLALLVGAGIIALATAKRTEPGARPVARRIWLVVGVAVAALALGDLVVRAGTFGFGALLVIAISLFALAWMERSRQCAVVAILFAAVSLLANLYDTQNLFYDLFGATGDQPAVLALERIALPAAVLIVGGIVALVTGARSRSTR